MPEFAMETSWSLDDLMGYLATWSSVVCFRAAKGIDPLSVVREALSSTWGRKQTRNA